MNQRCPTRLWNRMMLGALVLFVIGSALRTVAASAAAQAPASRAVIPAGAP